MSRVRRCPPGTARHLTDMQLAAAIERAKAGLPDPAAMTSGERREAGLMTVHEAVEWERLPIVPYTRPAERTHGPVPEDDIWATPAPEEASDAA